MTTTPAPYPPCAAEATADALARHFAVEAHRRAGVGEHEAAAEADAVAFLLRCVQQIAPNQADTIARDLWRRLDTAPIEGQAEDLKGYGIDPEAVLESARLEVARVVA